MGKSNAKFNIGDEIFYLNEKGTVKKEIITGIFTCFTEDLKWGEKKDPKFKEFMYYTDIKNRPRDYEWISESRLFATKKELIDSL